MLNSLIVGTTPGLRRLRDGSCSRPDRVEPPVPLYYFHLRDGQDVLLDPDGRDLPSLQAVHAATLREAREIIGHDARDGRIKLSYHIAVEDADGRVIHHLEFEDAVTVVRGASNA